ncbi:MAG: hypothetical protein J6V72_07465 [Kiritimatiellae bacterium]|nr:hypothetical protein [Kiritimatiellia bacterium]
MNRIWKFLRGLDWRVLLAVPVLSVLLGVANNLRVPVDQRVRWSGEPIKDVAVEADAVGAQRGAWTSDFDAATNAAQSAHVPVVVVVTQKGCQYCSRLHQALNGPAVKDWQKARGWYFVLTEREKRPDVADFVVSTPVTNTVAPYVGVYWTRADGTQAMRNFPGRQGMMGVKKQKELAQEWILAVEGAVPGAQGIADGLSVATIVSKARKRVAVAADLEKGAEGQVKMSPRAVRFLKEGQKVKLTAKPKKGSVLAGWRYPDGRVVRGKESLMVGSHYPEGTYTALFRRPENCAAPVLHLPEQEVAWTEWDREKLTLRINADAYPVSFSCAGLPPGVYLSSRSAGVIAGQPQTSGVWRVEVTVKGVERVQPAAKGTFTLRVLPRKGPKDDDGGADEDDEVN